MKLHILTAVLVIIFNLSCKATSTSSKEGKEYIHLQDSLKSIRLSSQEYAYSRLSATISCLSV